MAAIVGLYVSLDVAQDGTTDANLVIATMVQRWLTDRLIDNVVEVGRPGAKQSFVLMADGGYNPPPGSADVLTLAGGAYKITTKGKSVVEFNSTGQVTKQSDTNGNDITFAYTSGKLTSVSTEAGRTLEYGDRSTIPLSCCSAPLD